MSQNYTLYIQLCYQIYNLAKNNFYEFKIDIKKGFANIFRKLP